MENVLNKTIPKKYEGYLLQTVYDLICEPLGIESMIKFKRIPNKISAFIDKTKIKGVYQYDIKGEKHQYFIQFIDETWKELQY